MVGAAPESPTCGLRLTHGGPLKPRAGLVVGLLAHRPHLRVGVGRWQTLPNYQLPNALSKLFLYPLSRSLPFLRLQS